MALAFELEALERKRAGLAALGVPLSWGPSFPGRWVHGAAGEPLLQVHAFGRGAYVARFSKTIAAYHPDGYEGNFVFLFVGTERAILFDTGPCAVRVFKDVVRILALEGGRGGSRLDLVVAHTHGHGDHVAGDGLWADGDHAFRSVTVVGASDEEVIAFYGFDRWPEGIANYELGGRTLELVPVPGHHPNHVAIFDSGSKALVTGDFLYPGRLYVFDDAAFVASAERLRTFMAERAPIAAVLGCHIEMTSAPGIDYPTGTVFQPDEAAYELNADHVEELALVVTEAYDPARRLPQITRDRFIVVPSRL